MEGTWSGISSSRMATCIGFRRLGAIFTGFDSAWSAANSGAICDLVLLEDGGLQVAADPVVASWDRALLRAKQQMDVDLQIWAVDQPLGQCADGRFRVWRALVQSRLPAWAEGAPIWEFLSALDHNGYLQDPMAIPGAVRGRFYFECYPHPAILGLFDLDRILKYKVDHGNDRDWQELIRLLRSLDSAELPVRNIRSFVPESLRQNKRNEDKLDAILSAYVAAYWWKFGVQRSTMIGDLDTGYIVTPYSPRTLEALTRIFKWADEPANRAPTAIPNPPGTLAPCDWIYFAGPAKWSRKDTRDFVAKHKVIVRNIHNSARQRIANVRYLKAGETILLVYGGKGKPYRALFSGTITASPDPVRTSQQCFDVFTCIDKSLVEELEAGRFDRDPVVERFTGISLTSLEDLGNVPDSIKRPLGDWRALWRWNEVFH